MSLSFKWQCHSNFKSSLIFHFNPTKISNFYLAQIQWNSTQGLIHITTVFYTEQLLMLNSFLEKYFAFTHIDSLFLTAVSWSFVTNRLHYTLFLVPCKLVFRISESAEQSSWCVSNFIQFLEAVKIHV